MRASKPSILEANNSFEIVLILFRYFPQYKILVEKAWSQEPKWSVQGLEPQDTNILRVDKLHSRALQAVLANFNGDFWCKGYFHHPSYSWRRLFPLFFERKFPCHRVTNLSMGPIAPDSVTPKSWYPSWKVLRETIQHAGLLNLSAISWTLDSRVPAVTGIAWSDADEDIADESVCSSELAPEHIAELRKVLPMLAGKESTPIRSANGGIVTVTFVTYRVVSMTSPDGRKTKDAELVSTIICQTCHQLTTIRQPPFSWRAHKRSQSQEETCRIFRAR